MKKVKVGQMVVVNSLPDTQIYQVDKVEGHIASLSYRADNDIVCSGGEMDISILQIPTDLQYRTSLVRIFNYHQNKK